MRIGLIVGGEKLPDYVYMAALEAGTLGSLIAITPFVPRTKFTNANRVHLGQLGKILKTLKADKCTHVCFAGVIKRPNFKQLKPDLAGIRYLPGIIRAASGGDDALLRHMLNLFESQGFEIISPQEVCKDLMLGEGVFGAVAMTDIHRADALKACEVASTIGSLDVGQGAIVARGVTLAVEAQEGTDAMLNRVLDLPVELRGTSSDRVGVLAKMVKPLQDIRVDFPTLGPETVKRAVDAGLAGIVAEAGGAFVIDKAETIRLADEAGLFIVGLPKAIVPS